MDDKTNSLSPYNGEEPVRQADLPVHPAEPDPDDSYEETAAPINWKERLYDRIPNQKVALRFLDILIPVLVVLIFVFLFLGMH